MPTVTKNKTTTEKKYAIPAKAVKILRKVEEAILEEPRRLDMFKWGESGLEPGEKHSIVVGRNSRGRDILRNEVAPPCGTTACIGGHVMLLTPMGRNLLSFEKLKDGTILTNFDAVDTENEAAAILGISQRQAENLFYFYDTFINDTFININEDIGGWPKKYTDAYRDAKTAKARAQVTVRRIEHFIKTGK